MKLVMRHWQWLLVLLIAGVICATYIVAQTQSDTGGLNQTAQAAKTPSPIRQESADCDALHGA